jgi:hypothetical protein
MARIYYYKLTVDDGGAPCVQDGVLSLAICKPMIRTSAEPGDLIFGFAANSLSADNRLIYIAEVTAKIGDGDYYTDPHYTRRADCIYERHGDRFRWRTGALYHGPHHCIHDLGTHPTYRRAVVLLSDDFRYLGAKGTADYSSRCPLMAKALAELGRGHRVHHGCALREELRELKQRTWRQSGRSPAGPPMSAARSGVSHRNRSCGVLTESQGA